MPYADPLSYAEIYYTAARFNNSVLNFVDLVKKDYPSLVEKIRSYRNQLEEYGRNFFVYGDESPDSIIHDREYLSLQSFIDGQLPESQSQLVQRAESYIAQELKYSPGEDLFKCSLPLAGIIDSHSAKGSPRFTPQLILFLLMQPDFGEKEWKALQPIDKYLASKFIMYADGGPIPDFRLTTKDGNVPCGSFREWQDVGRFLNAYVTIIDWAYSDDEIIEEFGKILRFRRQNSATRSIPSKEKATYWQDIKFPGTVDVMLNAMRYYEAARGDHVFGKTVVECESKSPVSEVDAFSDFVSDGAYCEAWKNLVRDVDNEPKTKIPTNLGAPSRDARRKELHKRLEAIVWLIKSGFNLPVKFVTAMSAARVVRYVPEDKKANPDEPQGKS